jgi:hypothetical protein
MASVCLSMNLKNRAFTVYHGLGGIKCMAVFAGQTLLAGVGGFFAHGYQYGDDNGAKINAFARFMATDLGKHERWTVTLGYLAYLADSALELSWTADETASRAEQVVPAVAGSVYKDIQVRGDYQVLGTFLEFQVANSNGCDFTLNALRVIPSIKSGGLSR